MVVDEVVGLVERFAKLGQDDILLALQFRRVERRRTHQVGDQLDRQRHVGPHYAPMKHRLVARSPGIERPADVFDVLGDRLRVPSGCALEHHMLDKVCEAAERGRLRARSHASVDPD